MAYSSTKETNAEGEADSVLALARERGFDKCPICLELVVSQAVVTSCGHKFCEPCLGRHIDFQRQQHQELFGCPTCKELCGPRLLHCLVFFRDVKLFSCPFRQCEKKNMSLVTFEEHIRYRCPGRRVRCHCGSVFPAPEYLAHLTGVHGGETCRACGQRTWEQKSEHEKGCPELPTTCDCGITFLRKAQAEHQQTSCALRVVRCSLCGQPGRVGDTEKHQRLCSAIRCVGCSRIFRADQYARHEEACKAAWYPCGYEQCTFRGAPDELYFHLQTVHPTGNFTDTGIYGETEDKIFFWIDSEKRQVLARVTATKENEFLVHILGWAGNPPVWVSRSSPNLKVLNEQNVSEFMRDPPEKYPYIFPDAFDDFVMIDLFDQAKVSYRDARLLVQLERYYRCSNMFEETLGQRRFPDFREALDEIDEDFDELQQ